RPGGRPTGGSRRSDFPGGGDRTTARRRGFAWWDLSLVPSSRPRQGRDAWWARSLRGRILGPSGRRPVTAIARRTRLLPYSGVGGGEDGAVSGEPVALPAGAAGPRPARATRGRRAPGGRTRPRAALLRPAGWPGGGPAQQSPRGAPGPDPGVAGGDRREPGGRGLRGGPPLRDRRRPLPRRPPAGARRGAGGGHVLARPAGLSRMLQLAVR